MLLIFGPVQMRYVEKGVYLLTYFFLFFFFCNLVKVLFNKAGEKRKLFFMGATDPYFPFQNFFF